MRVDRPADKTGQFLAREPLPSDVTAHLAGINPLTGEDLVWPITNTVLTIGRDIHCSLSIPTDACLSRQHACITFFAGKFYLEDLGAANGTFLNGFALLVKEEIKDGDVIRVGLTELTFSTSVSRTIRIG